MLQIHNLSVLLLIFNYPFWGLNKDDHALIKPHATKKNHADHKMENSGNSIVAHAFLHFCVPYNLCFNSYIHAQSNFV